MTNEPMLNIRERAPVVIMGVLVAFHIIKLIIPESLMILMQPWLILVPIDTEGVTLVQRLFSLIGYGLIHAELTHLLMNGFMITAFGIVTITGIRADIRLRPHVLTPVQKFYVIFVLGVLGGGLFQWAWWSLSNEFAAAIGASGGGSALFATMAYAIGGKDRLLKFGLGWCVINILFAFFGATFGVNIAWAAHLGGFVIGIIFAFYWVRPNSAEFRLN